MTGAEPDPSIAIRAAGWRQGDVVAGQDTAGLLAAAIDRQPALQEPRLVVLSQDCDLVADVLREPFVELIAGAVIANPDPTHQNGRNPRWLDVTTTGPSPTTLRLSIHDRFRVPKGAFLALRPASDLEIEEDERRVLRNWVARRYTRAAFPDEFMRRLKRQEGKLDRLLKGDSAKLATAVFIATSDEELPAGTAYDVKVLIAAESRTWGDHTARDLLEAFGQGMDAVLSACDGIAVSDVAAMPEDDVSLGLLRSYKRLDVDYRSLPGDGTAACPSEQADSR